MRQITASVTFLPMFDEPCSFDLLIYTDKQLEVSCCGGERPPLCLHPPHTRTAAIQQTPKTWEESDPRFVQNSQEVRLRSFTTTIHKVDTSVTYKCDAQ